MRILVVDDSPSNIEICREILEEEFDVLLAADGHAAIRMAIQCDPDVVLLDVMLPGMDGYETCRRLRRLPGLKRPLIVFLTAKAMPAERAQGLDAGADAYLTKPFSDAELLEVVRRRQPARSTTWNDSD